MMKKQRRARPGFTLVEVAVVLIIIGIGVTMIVPRFAGVSNSTRANAAVTVIQSEIQRAYAEAAKNKRVVRVTINATTKRIQLSDRATGAALGSAVVLSGTQAQYPVTSMWTTSTTYDVFPNGTAAGWLVVQIQVVNQTRTILFTRVGHSRLI